MSTGLYTRRNYDTESQKTMPWLNKHALSEIWSFHDFNKLVRNVRLKARFQLVDKKRLIALVLMDFLTMVTLSLKQWLFVFPLLSISTSLPVIDWQHKYDRDKKERTRPIAQRRYPTERIQKYRKVGMQLVGIIPNRCDSKKSSWSKFQLSTPLIDEQLLQDVKKGRLFLYVQCNLKVSDLLNAYIAKFPPTFKNAVASKIDIGDLMEEYAKKKGLCHNQEECSNQASTYWIELSSLPYYYITCIWVLKVQKFINSVYSQEVFQ